MRSVAPNESNTSATSKSTYGKPRPGSQVGVGTVGSDCTVTFRLRAVHPSDPSKDSVHATSDRTFTNASSTAWGATQLLPLEELGFRLESNLPLPLLPQARHRQAFPLA